jgi:hypothetical protein
VINLFDARRRAPKLKAPPGPCIVADAKSVSLMLPSVVPFQKFIETTRETSVSFIVGKFDGILGLGYPDISVGKAPPIWYAFQLPNSRCKAWLASFCHLNFSAFSYARWQEEQKLLADDVFSFPAQQRS